MIILVIKSNFPYSFLFLTYLIIKFPPVFSVIACAILENDVSNAVTSVNLTKSKYGTFPEDMISETITAEFTVNTNCPFIITITYMDNLAPSIYLYEINYDDIDNYPGEVGLYNEFQSTGYADKILRFSWKCKNYSASTGGESTPTRIKISWPIGV